jgi:hypothetical protein
VRRTGCTGGVGNPETDIHYNAKWLLADIFHQIKFWHVCERGHRINHKQFDQNEWVACVEKKIPGTERIADVLLTNTLSGVSVALEVFHTHAVGAPKERECKTAGVDIIEIKALEKLKEMITVDSRDLDNEMEKCDSKNCARCQRDDKDQRAWRDACYRRWEQDERNHQELVEIELEQKRLQKILIQKQNATRDIERVEREKASTLKRLEEDRVKSLDLIEQERVRAQKRAFDREQREQKDARQRRPKPRTDDEDRLHKMRLEYKRMGIKIDF